MIDPVPPALRALVGCDLCHGTRQAYSAMIGGGQQPFICPACDQNVTQTVATLRAVRAAIPEDDNITDYDELLWALARWADVLEKEQSCGGV